MKSLFLFLVFLVGCATTNDRPLPTPNTSKAPVMVTRKYAAGDCVKFNPVALAKKGKRSDGTVMFVLGYKRDRPGVNVAVKYVIVMKHPRMNEVTQFTAVIKVFDADTDKVPCPK